MVSVAQRGKKISAKLEYLLTAIILISAVIAVPHVVTHPHIGNAFVPVTREFILTS